MDRAIAANEAAVIRWLLDYASVGDVAAYRVRSVEALRVRQGCQCGCASLDFAPRAWQAAAIIADAVAVYPDGRKAGVILWGRDGEIVLLELYDCHPGSSHRFPEISDLRSFTQGI